MGRKQPDAAPAGTPTLSVVVMGYRNGDTIVDAVESVVRQGSPSAFEVVVVTSGPASGADAVRRTFPGTRVIEHSARLMPGGARNLGIEHSSGTVVAFLEADCVAQPGWVAGRMAAHAAGYVAVAGSVRSFGRSPWQVASMLLAYCNRLPGRPPGLVASGDPRAHGLSITRDVLSDLGLFDPEMRIGEDTDMAHKLAAAGHPIWFAPEVCIAHRGPRSPRTLLRDEARRARRAVRHGVLTPRQGTGATLVVAQARMAWRRARRSGAMGWHYAAEGRGAVALALPWLLAGAIASRVGWWTARPPRP